jgi:hypothetical protein
LDQREDKALIASKFSNQIAATGGYKSGRLGFTQKTAIFEGITE